MTKRILALALLTLFPLVTLAQIDLFKKATQDQIDLESLTFTKEQIFEHVDREIQNKPLGVGKFGEVILHLCDLTIEGRRLSDLKNMENRAIRLLSNPSCDQIILRKMLQTSYDYKEENLVRYRDRQCVMGLSKVIKPLLAYYALLIEEPVKGCNYCQTRQKVKANAIMKEQTNTSKFCGVEAGKVVRFVRELSEEIEKSMRKKVANLK